MNKITELTLRVQLLEEQMKIQADMNDILIESLDTLKKCLMINHLN